MSMNRACWFLAHFSICATNVHVCGVQKQLLLSLQRTLRLHLPDVIIDPYFKNVQICSMVQPMMLVMHSLQASQ